MYEINETRRIDQLARSFDITLSTYYDYDSPQKFIKHAARTSALSGENYKLNVRHSLLSYFTALPETEVDNVLIKHKYNYFTSFSMLDSLIMKRYGGNERPGYHAARSKTKKFRIDRAFILEAFFLLHLLEVTELFSCKICLEENLCRKDMEGCSKGNNTHLYCM